MSNYSEDLTIDPDALDTEWLSQPLHTMKYAEACADARLTMDRVKEELDLVRAELDNAIRVDPERHGIEQGGKLTESRVGSLILQQDRYKRTAERYLKVKYDFEVLNAAVKAFDHRKAALENLVRLQGQGYFAGPMAPRDLKEEYANRQEARREETKGIVRDRVRGRIKG